MEEDFIQLDPTDFGITPDEGAEGETQEVSTEGKPVVEPTSETKEQPTEQPKENPYKFKVKVNHQEEEREFTKDDIVEAIQKKADYDKKYARNKELETEIQELKQELEFFGLKDKESLRQYRMETEIKQLVDEGMTEQRAKELVELKNAETVSKLRASEQAKKEAEDKEIAEFLTENNLKAEEVPEEVIEMWKSGKRLEDAYTKYQNKQLQKELQALKQNLSNEKKAVVMPTTEHGTTDNQKKDPFEEGFDSI